MFCFSPVAFLISTRFQCVTVISQMKDDKFLIIFIIYYFRVGVMPFELWPNEFTVQLLFFLHTVYSIVAFVISVSMAYYYEKTLEILWPGKIDRCVLSLFSMVCTWGTPVPELSNFVITFDFISIIICWTLRDQFSIIQS